jgi:mannitol-1-phosphate/altronate dehydrogenase
MQRNRYYFLILIISLIFISCNTSQKEQLDQLNSSIVALKNELNKTQEISLKSNSPRFQIVQSNIAAKGTFKLDTYEGKVYQLVVDYNNNESWQLLKRIGNSINDNQVDGQRNYEIFLSTIAMRYTYLINLNTGATWQLVEDPNTEEYFFSSISE